MTADTCACGAPYSMLPATHICHAQPQRSDRDHCGYADAAPRRLPTEQSITPEQIARQGPYVEPPISLGQDTFRPDAALLPLMPEPMRRAFARCTGCGAAWTRRELDAIEAVSCCPERRIEGEPL